MRRELAKQEAMLRGEGSQRIEEMGGGDGKARGGAEGEGRIVGGGGGPKDFRLVDTGGV